MVVLVGGVSELYQGDLDLGRRAAELLAGEPFGEHVLVEDLHYGAVGVVHRLTELAPSTLILVGATQRGREPGTVQRQRREAPQQTAAQAQAAVGHAVVGYVDTDLILQVAAGLDALPPRIVVIDAEPATVAMADRLSPAGELALQRAVALVRTEVRRTPLLELADTLRGLMAGERLEPAPAVDAMHSLLRELEELDHDGTWGATFRERDRLRLRIAAGESGEGMDHLDWSLWWALIEEVDRLQRIEAVEDLE
jgi:hydrogenase maturation protease